MRLSAIFIAVSMVVIAGSVGVVGYLILGLSSAAAGGTAFVTLSLLAAFHAFTTRLSGQAQLAHQLAELSRGTTELAHQVGELGRRVVAAEAGVAQGLEQARAAADPLAAELDLLGTVVKDLAESVAAHEAALGASAPGPIEMRPASQPVTMPAAMTPVPPPVPVALAPRPAPAAQPLDDMLADLETAQPDEGATRALAVELRAAVEDNRLDLYLQPIVTLPQRKVRHYEATARIRLEDGVTLSPAEYRAAANAAGLTPAIDNLLLLRVVQVARRLAGKNRDVTVLCEINGTTLANAAAFAQAHDFLSANRPLAPSLVLTLAQAGLHRLGPIEQESLAQIASLGFRFALGETTDLRLDGRQLAAQGFRFIKVPAPTLLDRNTAAGADIHPTDLASLLGRYAIELIADAVDTEGTVVDLLDYDVAFGQGALFGAPRAVRVDVLQGTAQEPPPAAVAAAPLVAPQITMREADPSRRRDADPAVAPRPAGERNPHGLVKLARNMMRRA
jgi:cyclic-di-GMP phosphodiesterase TipF (flagellum assembly factor)